MTWWHRNRWALLALPLALVLALVASGDRVRSLWWERDLRRATTAPVGEGATFRQVVHDGSGGTFPVEASVRLDGVEVVDDPAALPPRTQLPDGVTAVRVDLTIEADPDVVLRTCQLAVRDAAGTRYEYVWDAHGGSQPVSPCVPEDAPGPESVIGEPGATRSDPDAPRPPTFSVSRVVVVPQGVAVTDVALWWQLPDYVELELAAPVG